MLLLSPVRQLDPGNGDVTYTEQLVARPGPGVRYVTYDQALEDGSLAEDFRRRDGETAVAALRRAGPGMAREALANRARARGLLFREPFRHFTVAPGAFDLVHAHVFSVRLRSSSPLPLVVSNSIGLTELYRDGFGVAAARVDRLRRRDARLAALTGVTHAAYGQAGAAAVVCFSEHLRQRLLAAPGAAAVPHVVVPPGVEPGPPPDRPEGAPFHLGFVGDWRAKGGDLVLEAHRLLRREGWPGRLTVVGGEPRLAAEESDRLGVTWLPRLPREQLLEQVVPSFSAFAYPSRFDGLPLTLLEVMARGVPAVVSDYGALPEVVDHGNAGLVVPGDDVESLVAAVRRLADPDERRRSGSAARQRVLDRYDVSVVTRALAEVYAGSVGGAPGVPTPRA